MRGMALPDRVHIVRPYQARPCARSVRSSRSGPTSCRTSKRPGVQASNTRPTTDRMLSTSAADPAAWSDWGLRTPADECRAPRAAVDPRERVDIASSLHGIDDRAVHDVVSLARTNRCPRRDPQADGRIRFWGIVPELGNRVLRVVTLEDGTTVHNAFPDRDFPVAGDEPDLP